MPRAPRLEFENAIYHVMARGNRREPIVFDREDRLLFCETFGEVCEMTGWQVFAWVLMENHYHAVFRTPRANLVEGMKWFQNAYTRRLNGRKRLWGHLFGGRYRSILIEEPDCPGGDDNYLATAMEYVHLNPGRTGLVDGQRKSLMDYEWSSFARAYVLSPSKRPDWLVDAEGFELMGFPDTAAGRRRMVGRFDEMIRAERGSREPAEGSFAARLKRGWYWGSEEFREKLLDQVDAGKLTANQNYRSSALQADHCERTGQRIIESALRHYGIEIGELRRKIRGDLRRASVAWKIARNTTLPMAWIAEELNLKSAVNVSQSVRRFALVPEKDLPRPVRQWKSTKSLTDP